MKTAIRIAAIFLLALGGDAFSNVSQSAMNAPKLWVTISDFRGKTVMHCLMFRERQFYIPTTIGCELEKDATLDDVGNMISRVHSRALMNMVVHENGVKTLGEDREDFEAWSGVLKDFDVSEAK